jgi:hypothetical protein
MHGLAKLFLAFTACIARASNESFPEFFFACSMTRRTRVRKRSARARCEQTRSSDRESPRVHVHDAKSHALANASSLFLIVAFDMRERCARCASLAHACGSLQVQMKYAWKLRNRIHLAGVLPTNVLMVWEN